MKRRKIRYLLMLIILISQFNYFENQTAYAAMKNNGMITITERDQVIDTITYNNITVNAVYTYEAYASNNTTYSCAAFIKKFYSEIYGITVYNLNSTISTPLIYNSMESFCITASPQVGDIIRDNNRTHWAIVKQINGNKITAIQQSYKTGSTAFINGTIEMNDLGYTYFTYSNRIEDTQSSDIVDSNQSIDVNLTNNPTSVPNVAPSEQSIQESLFPKVTLDKKTLYAGFKGYTLSFTEVTQDAVFSFQSSNASIAKINKNGKITPVSEGIAFITVKIEQKENTYQYNVTVNVKKPYIKLTKTLKQLFAGETSQMSAEAIGMKGIITWSTSDETVAKIDSISGELYGIKKGTATITASCDGLFTISINIKIK